MNEPSRIVRYCASRRWAAGLQRSVSTWLTTREQNELAQLRHPQRREHWLQGRWLAKELLSTVLPYACPPEIEILSRADQGGLAPQVRLQGQPVAWRVTISHSQRGVLVALVKSEQWRVGADLAEVTYSTENFRRLWFTAKEQAWLAGSPQSRTAPLWALKESIYKACNKGEPWTPRAIEVLPHADGSHRCWYHGRALTGLQSSLHVIDGQTAAVVYLPVNPTPTTNDSIVPPVLCL